MMKPLTWRVKPTYICKVSLEKRAAASLAEDSEVTSLEQCADCWVSITSRPRGFTGSPPS